MKPDDPVNSRNGRVSGSPDARAERGTIARGLRDEPFVEQLSAGGRDLVGRNVVVILCLTLLRIVPDNHEIGLDAKQTLVGQIVPTRDTDRRAHTARMRSLDDVDLIGRRNRRAAKPA